MKKSLTAILFFLIFVSASAQKATKQEKIEKIKETLKNLPEDLIRQPEAAPDTNANKLISDNFSLEIPPLWKEKGTLSIIDFKLVKCDTDPLKETFPTPDKKLIQGVSINMNSIKKSSAEKKLMAMGDIQKHLTALYKEEGKAVSKEELAEQMKTMIISAEPFITNQGKTGEVVFMHDIQTQQSALTALLLIPGASGNTTDFIQLSYFRYVYETNFPEDVLEWRMFVYPDDQQTYIDFTKKMFKTFYIK